MAQVTDSRETYKILDLSLRIGEILLSSGAGAADVTVTMMAICHHFGRRNPDVDVTFTLLRMSYQDDPDELPVLLTRNVTQRDIDYDDLTRVHELVQDLLHDQVTLEEGRAKVARIQSTGHYLPRWAVTLGSGVVNGAIALLLDAGVLVTAVATLSGILITLLTRWMTTRRWPMFYQQVGGGLLATMMTVGVAALDLDVSSSLVITSSIILLLSGIGFMGAIQDALSGFYITAGARTIEAMLATAGLIAGVTAGLALAPALGVQLLAIRPGESGLSDSVPKVLIGAIVAASVFALTCYAPLRAIPAVAMTTVLGQLVFLAVLGPSDSAPWSAACAAVVVGVVSYSIAGRVRVPPLVVVVPAVMPMLPGLAIYRGLSQMSSGLTIGILQLSAAAATTIALAAGVILGETIAQPVKRNARRLEGRLAGPRMAGVLHGELGRRQRRQMRKAERAEQARRAKLARRAEGASS